MLSLQQHAVSIDFRDPAATTDFEDLGKAVNVVDGERQDIELIPVPEDK